MSMRNLKSKLVLLVAALAFTLAACASQPKPFQYETDRDLKPGPGLFSGEDGAFTIGDPEKPKK